MPTINVGGALVLVGGDFKPGDPAPAGYIEWQDWVDVQHKAGLRQKECGRCGKWRFPQELSPVVDAWTSRTTRGKAVEQRSAVCLQCAQAEQHGEPKAC